MIPIVVIETLLDLDIPAEDRIRLLRDAVERQKRINQRRTVIELPDHGAGWTDTGSGSGHSDD